MLLELNGQHHAMQRVSYHYQLTGHHLKDENNTYKAPEKNEKHMCFMAGKCELINCCQGFSLGKTESLRLRTERFRAQSSSVQLSLVVQSCPTI